MWVAGLLLGASQFGCGDDVGSAPTEGQDDPFVSAAALESTWCVIAQRRVAGYDESSLPEASLTQTTLPTFNDLISARAIVADGVLHVQAYVTAYDNPLAPAGAELSSRIACKLRTPDAIQSLLGMNPSGAMGSCRTVHEAAWDWARAQLSADELKRYEATGHKLTLVDDIANGSSSEWLVTDPTLTKDGSGSFTLASSALLSPTHGDYDDSTQGALYCKMWTPAQMLYWLRVRAFDADPIANEPKPPEKMMCTPAAGRMGSCTFFFSVASTTFCEDYVGSAWTAESGQAKCTMRGGTYSAEPCTARKAETDTFEGDGVFKGQCVLKCGTADEYIWNSYSGASDGSGCATGTWIPAP